MSEHDRHRERPTGREGEQATPPPTSNQPPSSLPASASSESSPAGQRERKPPKRVRFGLKLKAGEEVNARSEAAAQWLETISEMVDSEGRQEGLEYARLGQTVRIDILPGRVQADVQGRRGRPYAVTIEFDVLDQPQWNAIIDAMASEAVHVAKVLAGELPDRFLLMLASHRHEPPPVHEATEDVDSSDEAQPAGHAKVLGRPRTTCQCGYHRPCKHVAAVGYLLAERLDDEPLTVLTLLGLASDQVKEQLRQKRVMKTQGLAAAHPDQLAALPNEPPLPLEACVDEFWRYGPQLAELEQSPLPHHVPHALLRRLGPSPLNGRFPMVGLLASVYDTVARAAIELRDSAERSENE